jgi:hypothetical protein
MKAARNVAIIMLLALIVAAVPGGGNFAEAILATISITFMVIVGLAANEFYRRNRLTYVSLPDRQRGLLVGSLGAIVLMIAGASELTETGAGLLVWIAVIAFAVITIIKVAGDTRRAF